MPHERPIDYIEDEIYFECGKTGEAPEVYIPDDHPIARVVDLSPTNMDPFFRLLRAVGTTTNSAEEKRAQALLIFPTRDIRAFIDLKVRHRHERPTDDGPGTKSPPAKKPRF